MWTTAEVAGWVASTRIVAMPDAELERAGAATVDTVASISSPVPGSR